MNTSRSNIDVTTEWGFHVGQEITLNGEKVTVVGIMWRGNVGWYEFCYRTADGTQGVINVAQPFSAN